MILVNTVDIGYSDIGSSDKLDHSNLYIRHCALKKNLDQEWTSIVKEFHNMNQIFFLGTIDLFHGILTRVGF